MPADFGGEVAVELLLVGSPDVLQTTAFAGLARYFIEGGAATFLNVPRQLGVTDAQALLNPILGDAIAALERFLTRVNRRGFPNGQ